MIKEKTKQHAAKKPVSQNEIKEEMIQHKWQNKKMLRQMTTKTQP